MSLHRKTKRTRPVPQSTVEPDSPRRRLSVPHPFRFMRKWFKRTVLLLLLLVVVIPVLVYAAQPKYYRVLIIGSDQRAEERARSDVLMLVNIPKSADNPFSIVMIPRDTKVEHPEHGLEKITHFYAMWEDEETLGNKELTQEQVEQLLDVKVNSSVEVTFDSFIEIVDLLGGVDTEHGHLDGAEAKEIVHNRFVHPDGDFGRAAEQRAIMKSLLPALKKPSNASAVYNYFQETDRARMDIRTTSLATFGVAYAIGHRGDLSVPDIEEVVLPGYGSTIVGTYYYSLDEDELEEVKQQYLQ